MRTVLDKELDIQKAEEPKHEINWKAITVRDCELAANFGRMAIINDGMVVGFTPDEREGI